MAYQQKKRGDIATNSNSENSPPPSLYQLSSPQLSSNDCASINEHNNALVPAAIDGGASEAEVDKYLDSFPPGYRFKPHDEELVGFYLKRKILNEPLPPNNIKEVELYKHSPDTLAAKYKPYGDGEEQEWYFFTPRDRKYPNGERPNRAAGDGYWKATGADKGVPYRSKCPVGQKKSLVFYRGKPKSNNGSSGGGKKTNWIMHEFRLEDPNTKRKRKGNNDMKLDDWVLCRIYNKLKGGNRARATANDDDEKESDDHEKETKREEEEEYSTIVALDNPIPIASYNHEIDPYLNTHFPNSSLPPFQRYNANSSLLPFQQYNANSSLLPFQQYNANSSLLPFQQYNGLEENFGNPFQYHSRFPNEFNALENLDTLGEFDNIFDNYDPKSPYQPKPEA